jgi:plasmid stability protein
MASLVVRQLDDDTKERLRRRAAEHGRSMEAEARAILRDALTPTVYAEGFGLRVHRRFAAIGGVDLELPARTDIARAPMFDA